MTVPASGIPASPGHSSPPHGLLMGLVFVATFAVYCLTACRTIYTGDDGDIATAVTTLGVPHPTGYPLFILVGKLWTVMTPFLGEPAFRLNIFTALCGALTIPVAYRFIAELLEDLPWSREIAAGVSLSFAFTPTLWSQSVSCEVYTANILFLALLLLLSLQFIRAEPGDGADRKLCLLALVYGLALTHHLTIALFFPAFVALVVWRKPSLFGKDWRVLLSVIGCILLPLSLYIYIPLATKYSHSPLKWGQPDTPSAFWLHLTGGQYRDLMFPSVADFKAGATLYFGKFLPTEYGIFLLAVAAVGIVTLAASRRTRPFALLFIAIFVADVVFAAGYHTQDIFVFYIPSYLILAVCIACAGTFLIAWVRIRFAWDDATTGRYARLALPVLLATAFLPFSAHYGECDESKNRVESDYSRGLLRSCPRGAVLAVRGSCYSSLWYLQFVRGERPDVTIISQDMFAGVVALGGWYRVHLRDHDPRVDGYLPRGLPEADLNNGTALAATLGNALRASRPVVIAPVPNVDAVIRRYQEERRKAGLPAPLPDWWYGERAISRRFARVPWGFTERLFLKDKVPTREALFSATAPLWGGGKDAINADFDSLAIAMRLGNDELQKPIMLRMRESLVAWGGTAEAARRPDLALPAYRKAAALYPNSQTRDALQRLSASGGVPPVRTQ